jgi:hypothetical protein
VINITSSSTRDTLNDPAWLEAQEVPKEADALELDAFLRL